MKSEFKLSVNQNQRNSLDANPILNVKRPDVSCTWEDVAEGRVSSQCLININYTRRCKEKVLVFKRVFSLTTQWVVSGVKLFARSRPRTSVVINTWTLQNNNNNNNK